MGYFNPMTEHLNGIAKTSYLNLGPLGSSREVTACLPQWTPEIGMYDLIAFNWGLHDICSDVYGVVSREEYIHDMVRYYDTLKAQLKPNGKMIWVTSSPVPHGAECRVNDDIVVLNRMAADLWENYDDIETFDAYSLIRSACEPCYPQDCSCDLHIVWKGHPDVHMKPPGKELVGSHIASMMQSLLNAGYR